MKLVLNTLPKGRSEEIFDSLAPLHHGDPLEWEPLSLKVVLSIDNQNPNFYVHGEVSCTGTFTCDLGMEKFQDTLEGTFDIMATYDSRYLGGSQSDDVILIPAGESEIDFSSIVRDTVLLAIPISHTCGPVCPSWKTYQDTHKEESGVDDRWAKLKDLIKE